MFLQHHGAAAAQAAAGGGGGGAAFSAVESFSATGSNTSLNPWTYGWSFTVGASDLIVEAFQIYPYQAATRRCTIWRNSDSAVIAQVDFTTAEQTVGTWSEKAITEVTLSAGVGYTVSERNLVEAADRVYREPTGVTRYSGLTLGSAFLHNGATSDGRPTSSSFGDAALMVSFRGRVG